MSEAKPGVVGPIGSAESKAVPQKVLNGADKIVGYLVLIPLGAAAF